MTRGWPVLLPGADALTSPHGAGPQDTAQLASAWQVGPVPRAQREVLRLPRQEAARVTPLRSRAAIHFAVGLGNANVGIGKPVIGIGPCGRLLRIGARRADPLGEIR